MKSHSPVDYGYDLMFKTDAPPIENVFPEVNPEVIPEEIPEEYRRANFFATISIFRCPK